jgi:ABC-type lipoprotein release transport system permease subunit
MPTNIDVNQIVIIFIFSLSVSIIATIYPAYKASKTEIKGILGNG